MHTLLGVISNEPTDIFRVVTSIPFTCDGIYMKWSFEFGAKFTLQTGDLKRAIWQGARDLVLLTQGFNGRITRFWTLFMGCNIMSQTLQLFHVKI